MDDLLADRLREAEIDLAASSIAELEEATSGLLEELSPRDVPELLRLACAKTPRTDYDDRFRQHFRAANEVFPLRGEDHYVSVIALNALVQLLQQDGASSIFAALAARCARFALWKAPHPDLFLAADAQVQLAGLSRYPSRPSPRLTARPASVTKALEAVGETPDTATLASAVTELGSEVQRLRGYSSTIGPFASGLVEGLAEQVRIMWWLLSGWSQSRSQSFDELSPDVAPAVVAIELAGLTSGEPGPPATDALLHQALLLAGVTPDDQVSLAKCRKACEDNEVALPAGHHSVSDMTPVTSALSSVAPSGSRRSLESLALAREIYDELLLSRLAEREVSND